MQAEKGEVVSTVLRTFPAIARQGHQETLWSAAIPGTIQFLQLQGAATDPVLSDEANAINFKIYVSIDGTDANQILLMDNAWQGGVHHNKAGVDVPNLIDITFGPLTQYAGYRCKLAVDINNAVNNNSGLAMVVGGSVTSQP